MNYERLSEHVAEITGTPIREYNRESQLKDVFGQFNGDVNSFEHDLGTIKAYQQNKYDTLPFVYSDQMSFLLTIFYHEQRQRYVILGTVATKHFKTKCNVETICNAVALLYDAVYEIKLSTFDILTTGINQRKIQNDLAKKITETSFAYQELGDLHNPYEQELREQGSIREGNEEKLIQSFQESYSGRLATLSKDELRSIKNLGIVVLAISTRSAIKGGLHPEQAFILSDSYILKVDEAAAQQDVYNIVREAEIHLTKLVAENNQQEITNPLVHRTKNIILKNIHSRIIVGEIAKELKTSAPYLSAVFKEETRQTIQEYVLSEKLKIAENLLLYSVLGIEEIANYLAFSSQSHFGNVFKKKYKLTPNKYRQKYGVQRES